MAAVGYTAAFPADEGEYRRRIRAWTMYDWANSAFATTILAAVLPIYYSQVAGATLPSAAIATSYWSLGLSISLIVAAILSPILGTVSDIMRGKKRFLAVFATVGILATAALVFVSTGDWMLASMLAIIGRIGFTGSITFYDALLPHVARPKDQDAVSTRGYAMGYLGGGLLLAVNAVMIFTLGFEAGARLSFVSVAIWWAVFSVPLFRRVPEPVTASAALAPGQTVLSASFGRIWETMKDVRRYRELFKFLIAFLIYNDAIGTIIGVAAIYGAELGFGDIELILALLLVQFVGIPFSLIFGYLPSAEGGRRAFFLAFIIFNLVALPLVGIVGANVLPQSVTGVLLPPYESVDGFAGTGIYRARDRSLSLAEGWDTRTVPAAEIGGNADEVYAVTAAPDAQLAFYFNGQEVTVTHSVGPDHGIWAVLLDGAPLLADEDGVETAVVIDAFSPTPRYGLAETFTAPEPGRHTLTLVNTGAAHPDSTDTVMSVTQFEVLVPISQSSLPLILAVVIAVQLVGLLFAYTVGRRLFARLAGQMNTKRSIMLALVIYSVIAVWGFFLNSVIEFWFLAWMVAVVQGGSQALSRSLYSVMSPASKSGEFFGLFGVMEKFASFIGPLLFALAVVLFGSSRPAILVLIAFFIVGGYLLTRVNVEEGRRVAQAEDAAYMGGGAQN
jgi:UMF1 family MFS transporter